MLTLYIRGHKKTCHPSMWFPQGIDCTEKCLRVNKDPMGRVGNPEDPMRKTRPDMASMKWPMHVTKFRWGSWCTRWLQPWRSRYPQRMGNN